MSVLSRLLTESYLEKELNTLTEILDPRQGAYAYIHDFVRSKNRIFRNKSKKERIRMALGAFYSAKRKMG